MNPTEPKASHLESNLEEKDTKSISDRSTRRIWDFSPSGEIKGFNICG